MKVKVLKSPVFSSISHASFEPRCLKLSDHRRRQRYFPYTVRLSIAVWVCLLLGVMYFVLSFVELDSFRSALKKIKLRSSSTQHDHEDTTNSGSHDLQDKTQLELEMIDLPAFADLPRALPLMEPQIFDESLESEGHQSPEVTFKDTIVNVAFVDTPAEERRQLVRTKKRLPDSRSESKEGSRERKFGGRSWGFNFTVKWVGDSTQNGSPLAPLELPQEISTSSPKDFVTTEVAQETVTQPSENLTSEPLIPKVPFPTKHMDFGYDESISKAISVSRKIPDGRHDSCKLKDYNGLSLKVSVVIAVYNEAWHVLLRTIHSVLERSPARLLKEVVIVDDHSDEELAYMKEEFHEYVKQWDKVKVFRNEKREGLIWSRMNAATNKAQGDIIVFFDSHVEVNVGWLEPLVERIEKNWQVVAVPILDKISPQTFEYSAKDQIPTHVVAFQWDLKPLEVPAPLPEDGVAGAVPIPISSDGQFAISKRFFNLLGGFDSTTEFFGGENLEMSFKAWMCGGRVELVPCSRVGHLSRGRLPALMSEDIDTKIHMNLLRVAKTWMDEHSVLYENSIKSLKKLDDSDITGGIQLKTGLGCKSFDWYLKNVYPQLYNPLGTIIADGEIRSSGMDGSLCLDAISSNYAVAKLFPCHGEGGNQRWWYTIKGEIRRYDQCLDYWGKEIQFFPCHGQKGNQFWQYLSNTSQLKHVSTEKCMTVVSQESVDMEPCEEGRFNQQWTLDNFNTTAYVEHGFHN